MTTQTFRLVSLSFWSAVIVTPTILNLGIQGCTGRSVQVVTDVTITADQKIKLTKRNVCVVN